MAEPLTITILGSGTAGIAARFARKNFRVCKRAMDIIFSAIGLIIASPIILICGILVKLTSRGPIFYRQTRVGLNGDLFDIIKLRTMREDAEAETGPVWAGKDDPRVTPVGRFLRDTYLDELPQLINVLKGEMSIIGPRPERPFFVDKLEKKIPDYQKRLTVRPGITGLAQVKNGSDKCIQDVRRKIKYDLLYIKKMCWVLEFKIAFWTVGRMIRVKKT